MKFLPKYFTKMYKFWIKPVVLYPKMFWSPKKYLLTMKFLPKNFTKMYICPKKTKKICTFYSKNEAFAKKIHQNVQILDKNCSFLPKNVHLVLKNKKNCNFYTKNEVFAKKFRKKVQILDKNCSFVPKNVHLVLKKQSICTFYSKNGVFAKKFH